MAEKENNEFEKEFQKLITKLFLEFQKTQTSFDAVYRDSYDISQMSSNGSSKIEISQEISVMMLYANTSVSNLLDNLRNFEKKLSKLRKISSQKKDLFVSSILIEKIFYESQKALEIATSLKRNLDKMLGIVFYHEQKYVFATDLTNTYLFFSVKDTLDSFLYDVYNLDCTLDFIDENFLKLQNFKT